MMTIELIVDENCFSFDAIIQIKEKLTNQFSDSEVKITSFDRDPQRMTKLGINILPALLIDNEVVRINPFDFDLLKKEVLQKLYSS